MARARDMKRAFTVNVDNRIATVLFDLPDNKVNVLTPAVLDEFAQVLEELDAMSPELDGAVILSGKADTFIAGADISIIENIRDADEATHLARRGQQVFAKLESLSIPVVAAINGACLGGGLELALACTWRVASDGAKTVLAFPEVQLGIIPGFGGTQRLPKLVGLVEAAKMITTGARVFARKAQRIGLVDEVVVRQNLLKAAKRFIGRKKRGPGNWWTGLSKPGRFLLEHTVPGRNLVFRKAREQVRKAARDNYPAPPSALDAMEEGLRHGMEQGLDTEAHLIGDLAVTETSKNLIRVFRLRERFAHVDTAPARDIRRIGVMGAGVMGSGIVNLAAEKGLQVRLINSSEKRLGGALKKLHTAAKERHRRGILTDAEALWMPGRVTYDTVIRGLGGAQLVIEAVAERMEVKRSILADIARATRGDAIIATNTSSLSVSEMQKDIAAPERVAGMHFFNPVDRMPLVEIVRGEKTSPATVERLMALAGRLGKIPVEVSDRPGFIVNRLLLQYLNEAAKMLEAGVPIEVIDGALRDFGMPMGAFILLDTIGLDVATHAADNLYRAFGERMKASPVLKAMMEAERIGRKVGKGFYRYDRKGKRSPDYETRRVLRGLVREPVDVEPDGIVRRLIYVMINEAARCLEEEVVQSAEAVDVAMILGAGFPPWTGGLLRYADSRGTAEIVRTLEELERTESEAFKPAGLLAGMASAGAGFYTAAPEKEVVTT